MTQLTNKLLATIALALLSGSAAAAAMSKAEYKIQEEKIEVDHKAAKESCKLLAKQTKSVCLVQAKGNAKNAKAELEMKFKPSADTHYTMQVVQAEASYDLAREHCNEKTSNEKEVCVKEAKAAHIAARADAKVQMATYDANAKANLTKVDARSDAFEEKNTAQFKVAQQKCEALAGSAKANCLDQAKHAYGK